jgi:hypothetical protein
MKTREREKEGRNKSEIYEKEKGYEQMEKEESKRVINGERKKIEKIEKGKWGERVEERKKDR